MKSKFTLNEWQSINKNTLFYKIASVFFTAICFSANVYSQPSAPTNLKVKKVNETQAILKWDEYTGADFKQYMIYRGLSASEVQNNATSGVALDSVVENSYSDRNVSVPNSYYYLISVKDINNNESDFSNLDSVTIDIIPASPEVTAHTILENVVNLLWDDNQANDLEGYKIYKSPNPNFIPDETTLIHDISDLYYGTNSFFTDSNVEPEKTTYYIVSAYDSEGLEGFSEKIEVTTRETAKSALYFHENFDYPETNDINESLSEFTNGKWQYGGAGRVHINQKNYPSDGLLGKGSDGTPCLSLQNEGTIVDAYIFEDSSLTLGKTGSVLWMKWIFAKNSNGFQPRLLLRNIQGGQVSNVLIHGSDGYGYYEIGQGESLNTQLNNIGTREWGNNVSDHVLLRMEFKESSTEIDAYMTLSDAFVGEYPEAHSGADSIYYSDTIVPLLHERDALLFDSWWDVKTRIIPYGHVTLEPFEFNNIAFQCKSNGIFDIDDVSIGNTLADVLFGDTEVNPVPDAPINLDGALTVDDKISLTWNHNTEPDIQTYNVYRSEAPSVTIDPTNLIASIESKTYLDTTVVEKSIYYYLVTAVDNVGQESSGSVELEFNMNPQTGKAANAFSGFNIYPNPTNGLVNVISFGKHNVQVNLYNQIGKLIMHKEITSSQQIDLSKYSKGLYFLVLSEKDYIETHKIILK